MKQLLRLDIVQETKRTIPSSQWWHKTIQQALQILKEQKKVSLTIIFVSPKKIKSLNTLWRGKNQTGMILSFPIEQPKVSSSSLEKFLGDIFLCPSLIEQQAKKNKVAPKVLYQQLIVHGLLHLYGYSHHLDSEWKKMKAMENKILNYIQK